MKSCIKLRFQQHTPPSNIIFEATETTLCLAKANKPEHCFLFSFSKLHLVGFECHNLTVRLPSYKGRRCHLKKKKAKKKKEEETKH